MLSLIMGTRQIFVCHHYRFPLRNGKEKAQWSICASTISAGLLELRELLSCFVLMSFYF